MALVLIPAGSFDMGSPQSEIERTGRVEEGPVHRVRISRSFWLGVHEVTQEQFEAVMGVNPSRHQGNPRLPVTSVEWDDAVAFCERLSQREGKRYRLPTEAEWEYACRAGTTTPWFFGDSPERAGEYAVCSSEGLDRQTAEPVGTRRPNPWGLYDMYGNVEEWVLDRVKFDRRGGGSEHEFDLPLYPSGPQTDPKGMDEGIGRIRRGGSFSWGPHRSARSARRRGHYAFVGSYYVGFRVLCESSGSNR